MGLGKKISYGARWLPGYAWQRLTRRAPAGPVHLIIALADHFEPAIVAGDGHARAPHEEQERRLERWCREYPKLVDQWRDSDGHPFKHTYFYPAEQYDRGHVERLAEHCHAGWGEVEIHLHHGTRSPDTAENTRRQLVKFRDLLAHQHGCLSYLNGSGSPQYAFVHGNFALANSNEGRGCGVDSEMQVLAETGCYADMTMPAAAFHVAQTGKTNSLYECGLPLDQKAPHRKGRDLERGRAPQIFPLMVQGPLLPDFASPGRGVALENGALTGPNPPSLRRLHLWKKAGISVQGRPDWLFIKLHCHSMDPTQEAAVLGEPVRKFLGELVEGAQPRGEILHFVSAREMVNMILAACDGRDGNPGGYRDYRLQRNRAAASAPVLAESSPVVVKR
ncbi:MAG: hypothetical protein WB421_14610 [Terriglobales bacterium]|jgi:hypothetical protein